MAFVIIEPEASGSTTGRTASRPVTCVFDYWLGDDVVRAYPAVLVTAPVKTALQALPDPTGFRLAEARIEASGFYRQHNPDRSLPSFWALDVHGEPGRDDMGLTDAGEVVVSRRVLDLLLEFRIGRAVLAQYAPGAGTARAGDGA